ncbi:hypothetical protein HPB47_004025 [Ixodes persulcatus]|uniref:Uncharacterized protein n=1 Tax=Ixodes persulcatus TaxID=34615 RepID=A0AC60PI61_IXOPE|nr:hypothetical protein HPB47_004025 [Ixodes persulcatus]
MPSVIVWKNASTDRLRSSIVHTRLTWTLLFMNPRTKKSGKRGDRGIVEDAAPIYFPDAGDSSDEDNPGDGLALQAASHRHQAHHAGRRSRQEKKKRR